MQPQTQNYLLRGIRKDLYKRIKVAAAKQEKTLKQWISDALIFYLKNGRNR